MERGRPVKTSTESRRPGRPRSLAARRAILDAARELMERNGITAVTMEGIAARAGVGKPTIYRTWPNAQAVAMAALMEAGPGPVSAGESRSPLHALKRQLRAVAEVFAARTGRNVAFMLAAAERDSEFAKLFRNHFILERRREGRELLEQAIRRKELRRDLDLEVVLDLIYAPIFYRLLVGHAPLDARFTDAVLNHALRGLAA